MPIVFERKELRPGSGGTGRSPGGDGQSIQFRMRTDAPWVLNAVPSRLGDGPEGLDGGGAGAGGHFTVNGKPISTAGRSPSHPTMSCCSKHRVARATARHQLNPFNQPDRFKPASRRRLVMKQLVKLSLIAAAAAIAASAHAQGVYKIGIAAGLTGYAATVDRAWTDGVRVAVDVVNAAGGVNGRRLEVIVEDNRSEPQEAVTVYKK